MWVHVMSDTIRNEVQSLNIILLRSDSSHGMNDKITVESIITIYNDSIMTSQIEYSFMKVISDYCLITCSYGVFFTLISIGIP